MLPTCKRPVGDGAKRVTTLMTGPESYLRVMEMVPPEPEICTVRPSSEKTAVFASFTVALARFSAGDRTRAHSTPAAGVNWTKFRSCLKVQLIFRHSETMVKRSLV